MRSKFHWNCNTISLAVLDKSICDDVNLKSCKLKPFNLMTDELKKQLENSDGRRTLKTRWVKDYFCRKNIRAENPRWISLCWPPAHGIKIFFKNDAGEASRHTQKRQRKISWRVLLEKYCGWFKKSLPQISREINYRN